MKRLSGGLLQGKEHSASKSKVKYLDLMCKRCLVTLTNNFHILVWVSHLKSESFAFL